MKTAEPSQVRDERDRYTLSSPPLEETYAKDIIESNDKMEYEYQC